MKIDDVCVDQETGDRLIYGQTGLIFTNSCMHTDICREIDPSCDPISLSFKNGLTDPLKETHTCVCISAYISGHWSVPI